MELLFCRKLVCFLIVVNFVSIGAMKVAIIGAGCAGLVSARYCLKYNFQCDVYEQTDKIGGVWNYTDKTGLDEYDVPIHTVMYKDLRTNVPKELMAYADFPYPKDLKSFLTQPQVLDYMRRYVQHFNLMPVIKFYKQVMEIRPLSGTNKWKLTVMDMKTKNKEQFEYDAIMICNGHYHKVSMPKIDGMESFPGVQMHSNVYRSPERFKHKRVLVIGAGPSGSDIATKVATVANKCFLSHRFTSIVRVPSEVIQKPVVSKISEDEILFEDGSKEKVDAIIYSTGYKFDFPFLTKECGITNEGYRIKHLYKHVINVEHPTMGFIGVCNQICPFPVSDVQVQFFLGHLNGDVDPKVTKEQMLEDVEKDLESRLAQGWPVKQVHRIAERQKEYCDDLAKLAKFTPLPPVYQDLYLHVRKYRNVDECFDIIDDNNYVQIECK